MMWNAEDLKYWLRSGSYAFMRHRHRPSETGDWGCLRWHDKPIYYRPGTSDLTLIYRILLKPERKREYRFPDDIAPRVILDIGANIGITTVLLAHQYPSAKILSFEPVPSNLALLKRNAASYPNVEVVPVALGAKDGELPLSFSDDETNFGGFSFFGRGVNPDAKVSVPVREVRGCLAGLGVSEVDLIKIDTEGAEHEILTAMSPELLARARYVTGELHGERDYELLAYLSRWFDVSVQKPPGSRLGEFQARRKEEIL